VRTASPLLAATGGAPVLPLIVLFLFNLVDEFDRVAFSVLSPEIRDTFGLSDRGIVAIGSIAGVTSLIAALPIGVLADRLVRVRMAAVGAGVWGAFTIVTALSPATWVLAIARTFAGVGRIVNEPVHASLLTDYYRPVNHPRVFALHRLANPIGLTSALLIGVLGALFDWRLVFAFLCVPTFLLLPVLLRLREPVRGESVDAEAAQVAARAGHVSFGDARRQLFGIRTLRRLWLALPVLGIAILMLTQLTSLFFEREYGYGPTGRGVVTFLSGVGIVIGLGLGQKFATSALAGGRPERLATYNGMAVAGVGLGIAGMVLSPWPELSALLNLMTGIGIGAYQPSYFSLVALVSPARIRAQAYAYAILFLGGGGLLAPTFASIGENSGYRLSLGILATTIVAGGLVIMTASRTVRADAERAAAALTEQQVDGPEVAAAATLAEEPVLAGAAARASARHEDVVAARTVRAAPTERAKPVPTAERGDPVATPARTEPAAATPARRRPATARPRATTAAARSAATRTTGTAATPARSRKPARATPDDGVQETRRPKPTTKSTEVDR
jgi:MFS family permease